MTKMKKQPSELTKMKKQPCELTRPMKKMTRRMGWRQIRYFGLFVGAWRKVGTSLSSIMSSLFMLPITILTDKNLFE